MAGSFGTAKLEASRRTATTKPCSIAGCDRPLRLLELAGRLVAGISLAEVRYIPAKPY